jgi:putative PIG3 family NAD(P)H quinone oxidoreductase
MKAVLVTQPGGPEVLALGDAPDPLPAPGEVLVRVRAAGVNRADILQRLGKYPPPPGASEILGLEVAGEVLALGANATRWKIGDRIMGLVTGGAYAERCKVSEVAALPIPAGLDFEHAAAIPEAFLTAWLNLFDLGLLERGETVLIHAGASGVGAAAIQLAREVGARVLTTVGSAAKQDWVMRLGASRAILRHDEDIAKCVLEATEGAGVHLVLDVVGAPSWDTNTRVLRPQGRLVLIGFLGGSRGELDLGPILRKNLHVTGTGLRSTPLEQKALWIEEFAAFARGRFESGSLVAPVDRVFPLADAASAHRFMEENQNSGKIVLRV